MIQFAKSKLLVVWILLLATGLGCGSSSDSARSGASMEDLAKAIDAQQKQVQSGNDAAASVTQEVKAEVPKIADPSSLAGVQQVLAPREVDVEVLGPNISPELEAIQTKMDKAVHEHGHWLQEYVKSTAREGDPLPYHPNFGITDEEYHRYFDSLKDIKLVPAGKGRLRFTALSNSKMRIESVNGLPELNGVVVDTELDQVITPWGTALVDKPVHTTGKSWLGRWDAHNWKLYAGSPESGSFTILEMGVGRQTDSALNIIHFRATVAENGIKKVQAETVIRFSD
jgi:hypothetical protein